MLGPPYDERTFTDDPLSCHDAGPTRLLALMTLAAFAHALNDARASEWIEARTKGDCDHAACSLPGQSTRAIGRPSGASHAHGRRRRAPGIGVIGCRRLASESTERKELYASAILDHGAHGGRSSSVAESVHRRVRRRLIRPWRPVREYRLAVSRTRAEPQRCTKAARASAPSARHSRRPALVEGTRKSVRPSHSKSERCSEHTGVQHMMSSSGPRAVEAPRRHFGRTFNPAVHAFPLCIGSAVDADVKVAKGLFGSESAGLDSIAPLSPQEAAQRKADSAATVAVEAGASWTCPVCGYAKNPGGHVRCAQCRTEVGRR